MAALLEVKNLVKKYNTVVAVNGASFSVDKASKLFSGVASRNIYGACYNVLTKEGWLCATQYFNALDVQKRYQRLPGATYICAIGKNADRLLKTC